MSAKRKNKHQRRRPAGRPAAATAPVDCNHNKQRCRPKPTQRTPPLQTLARPSQQQRHTHSHTHTVSNCALCLCCCSVALLHLAACSARQLCTSSSGQLAFLREKVCSQEREERGECTGHGRGLWQWILRRREAKYMLKNMFIYIYI